MTTKDENKDSGVKDPNQKADARTGEDKPSGQLPEYEGSPASVYYDGDYLKPGGGEGTPNDPNTNEPITDDPRFKK